MARTGRPTTYRRAMMAPVPLRLPEGMRAEIDDIVSNRDDGADLSHVLRELLSEALAARRKSTKK
jgi:hypothetical protein